MGEIRPAVLADIPLLAVQLATLPLFTRYGHNVSRLEQMFAGALQRNESLLVFEENGPRGLVWFLPTGTFALGGYLRLLAVAPDFHRKGTGSLLLGAFEDATFEKSGHAYLLVSDFNTDAQRFYEQHGYLQVGSMPGLVLPDISELIYWKRRPKPV